MNYFNYFTEIEQHFQRQRGAQIYLSTMDWALIDSWREAGIPLAAVLLGIDQAFEKFASGRRRDSGRPRALVYCAAAVLDAARTLQASSVGAHAEGEAAATGQDTGFSRERVAAFLLACEGEIAASPSLPPGNPAVAQIRATLVELAAAPLPLEDLDRVLTALDDKLQATLQQCLPVEQLVAARAALERELAPYRRTLRTEQLAMIERQLLQRHLLEGARLPRLSLFHMK